MSLPSHPSRIRISPALFWFCRIMSAFCIIAVVITVGVNLTLALAPGLFAAAPSPGFEAGLLRDPGYVAATLLGQLFLVWAFLSAALSFVRVSNGDIFSRKTILGLRNLALGVLLMMTVGAFAQWLAKFLYNVGQGVRELSISVSFSSAGMLLIVFNGAVAVFASVLAHAAPIAEENAQFV